MPGFLKLKQSIVDKDFREPLFCEVRGSDSTNFDEQNSCCTGIVQLLPVAMTTNKEIRLD
jgi:hypothetical protein